MIGRASKLIVAVSLIAAVGLEGWFVSDGWHAAWALTVGAFAATAAVATIADDIAAAMVLLLAYTFPALIILAHHRFYTEYDVVWIAALLGVMAPRALRSDWGIPAPWRAPLVLWALTVALAWPIVVLREIDFGTGALDAPRLASSIGGSFPQFAAITVLNVSATLGVGILWFDWLFVAFAGDTARFRRRIVGALALGWVAAILVSGYQLFGDLTFLSAGIFASMGRATSTMGDANAFGMIAAVSGAMVMAWSLGAGRARRWPLAGAAAALSWMGLWASGSRTAFVAGVVVLFSLVWSVWRHSHADAAASRKPLAAVVAIVVLLIAVGASVRLPAVGAVQRFRDSLPSPNAASVSAFVKEMWRRNNYGAAAAIMIREHPLVGVGVGGYYILLADYSKAVGSPYLLPADNAQNWYRHQLAEFGLLGSIGWILWVAMFGWFVVFRATPNGERVTAGVLKGGLVALAIVSLVGMPTQNTTVALTFWTIAFWICSLAGAATPEPSRAAGIGVGRSAAMAVLLCLFLGGTAYAARHELRPAQRAARAGWPYSYGFYAPEHGPDGHEFRWAEQRAVTVLRAPKRWLRLTVSVNHADLERKPVHAKVWRDDRLVLDTTLGTPAPDTEYVAIPRDADAVVLETWVNRVVRPSTFGAADSRDLGLIVQWDFVDAPPAGAAIADR